MINAHPVLYMGISLLRNVIGDIKLPIKYETFELVYLLANNEERAGMGHNYEMTGLPIQYPTNKPADMEDLLVYPAQLLIVRLIRTA
jgi:hypothetical protein